METAEILIGLMILVAVVMVIYDRFFNQKTEVRELHVDIHLTQSQIDNQETAEIHVPGLGDLSIAIPSVVKDGYMLRLTGIDADGSTLIAHIHVDPEADS